MNSYHQPKRSPILYFYFSAIYGSSDNNSDDQNFSYGNNLPGQAFFQARLVINCIVSYVNLGLIRILLSFSLRDL